MTLNELIEELENARNVNGGNVEVRISLQTKVNASGVSGLTFGSIQDIVCIKNHVGIWAMEPEEFEKES